MSDDLVNWLRDQASSFAGFPRAKSSFAEAADRIEAQQAEIARLRVAVGNAIHYLERSHRSTEHHCGACAQHVSDHHPDCIIGRLSDALEGDQ